MKKALLYVTGLMMLSLTTICFADETWHVGDDRHSDVDYTLTEGSQAVYFRDSIKDRLYYLDEEDMNWYILCSKPECDHSDDNLCSAYVPALYS